MMRHTKCAFGLVFALGLVTAPALAADNPELSALFHGRSGPEPKNLKIARLEFDVDIVGGAVQTVATATFANPVSVPTEGDFMLDLPSGSVVTGYALDVNGGMVDGVLIDQRKGKRVYQEKVRRGVDPGLAEVTRTNAFRTHVFPIFPGRGRTIRLSFVTPLVSDGSFVLPLKTTEAVGKVSIHVTASAQEARPRLKLPEGFEVNWAPGAAGIEARADAVDKQLSGAVEIAPTEKPQTVALGLHKSGEVFFEINDTAQKTGAPMRRPNRVRVYWDHSLSRRDDDLAAESQLLHRYLEMISPGIVDLVLFSDKGPELRTFESPNAVSSIDTELKSIDYRGATSIDGVLSAGLPTADACLFFSDATISIDSYGDERLRCTMFAVSSARDANRGFLASLAKSSAGTYLDLTALSIDDALARMGYDTPRVESVTTSDGRNIDYAVLPSPGDRFRVVGPLPTFGDVIVHLSGGKSKTYPVNRARLRTNDALGALWAISEVAELGATDKPNADEILALARRYSVVSPGTAFIVLETLNDYAVAKIEPPLSMGKQALANYRQMVAISEQQANAKKAERLSDVIASWSEEKNWWRTPFPVTPPQRAAAETPVPPVPQVSLPPTPPPPSVPPPAQQGSAPSEAIPETVLITGSLIRGTVAVGVPVVNLNAQDFAMTGAVDRADLFRTFPSANTPSGSANTPSDTGGGETKIGVQLEPWNPTRPYLTALQGAGPAGFAAVYREQEQMFGMLPAFYLDVGEYVFRQGRSSEAADIALSALELPTADDSTLMILADRMMRYGEERRAIWLYEKVLALEPDRPQPRRSLALALIARAEHSSSRAEQRSDYVRALNLLNEIVVNTWSNAYDGIELIALMEANRIVPRLARLGVTDISLDSRLIAQMDVDLRVVLEWDADMTDVDLWIDEPSHERAFYAHPRSAIGGRVSHDMTAGYGPEEYMLHHAAPGVYTVWVNVFGTDRLNPNGAITVRARLFRGYSRDSEQSQAFEIELRPAGGASTPLVGRFTVDEGMQMASRPE